MLTCKLSNNPGDLIYKFKLAGCIDNLKFTSIKGWCYLMAVCYTATGRFFHYGKKWHAMRPLIKNFDFPPATFFYNDGQLKCRWFETRFNNIYCHAMRALIKNFDLRLAIFFYNDS
eukprot:TRINITY_DN11289_c1_g1_i1.p1 TRINITY_DN11289_c1_g1~~TRINITY_DN11289_c1_g1_i1.p1  ORF type:complete len:116 (+),score=2.98 TRINITY_DN11289_c1_g1_i1:232-579(+)